MASWISVHLCEGVYMYLNQRKKCLCACLCSVCIGAIFLSVCRLAEVSGQTRSGWLRSCEHYTDTHTVALLLHRACQCLFGVACLIVILMPVSLNRRDVNNITHTLFLTAIPLESGSEINIYVFKYNEEMKKKVCILGVAPGVQTLFFIAYHVLVH